MVENKGVINIVYDDWDEMSGEPYANDIRLYNNKWHFWMAEGLLQHYIDQHLVDPIKHPVKYDMKQNTLQDVYNNPNEKYYYFIGHAGASIEHLFEHKCPIKENVEKCLKECDNFLIVFRSEHEPDCENSFKILHQYLIENNINQNQIYIINNNNRLNEYKIKYNSGINVHELEFLASSSTIMLRNVGGCEFVPIKRGKFFMCFNKSPKRHRIALLSILKKNYLLSEINWSYVPDYPGSHHYMSFVEYFGESNIKYLENEINDFINLDMKRSEFEENKGWFNPNEPVNNIDLPGWMQIPEYPVNYENSYVNITTESKFDDIDNVIHITEKSFKPFYYYQFPMIMASHHHIKKMKEKYDLDFFDDIINHDYDNEPDQKERLIKFVNEIIRLYKNKESLIEFYKTNQLRFELNKQKILKNLEYDGDFLFFKSLANGKNV